MAQGDLDETTLRTPEHPVLKRRYTNVEPKAVLINGAGSSNQNAPVTRGTTQQRPSENANLNRVPTPGIATNASPLGVPAIAFCMSDVAVDPASTEKEVPPMAKRMRDTAHLRASTPPPPAGGLRRRLTPRISWSSLLGESQEDVNMDRSPPGRPQRLGSFGGLGGLGGLAGCGAATPPGPAQRALASPPMTPRVGPSTPGAGISSPPPAPARRRVPEPNALDGWPSLAGSCEEAAERFAREFDGVRKVGSGHFSVVYRARNLLDGQEYAIKKTKEPLARGAGRRREMLQEALALASVAIDSPCPYIVRYFSSWIEDDRLFIQTELCDGSLKDSMVTLRQTRPHDPRFDDEELAAVIRDVCMGLGVLHGKNLVHLDVKPENVLVKNLAPATNKEGSAASKMYKIADLGLATAAIGSGCDEINEGDSRYLAREVLQGDVSNLTKADVFSVGLMCYELATSPKGLPCNGPEWHCLRDGGLDERLVDHLSATMLALVRAMAHPLAVQRPPCAEVLKDPAVGPQNLSGEDAAVVEALQRQLHQRTEAAEHERKLRESAEQNRATAEEKAAMYLSELVHMKRKEMLRDAPPLADAPAAVPTQNQFTFRRDYRRAFTA